MITKMKVQSVLLSLLAVCVFSWTSAQASELKVGYIDVKTALESTAEYQIGMKRLKALSDVKLKGLRALKEKITKAEKDIMSQSLAMSREHLVQKQQGLKDLTRDFQRMQQDAQAELSAEKERMDIASMANFQKVLTTYGKTHHFDMIMPKPMFLYADPKHDVTGAITKLLDAKK